MMRNVETRPLNKGQAKKLERGLVYANLLSKMQNKETIEEFCKQFGLKKIPFGQTKKGPKGNLNACLPGKGHQMKQEKLHMQFVRVNYEGGSYNILPSLYKKEMLFIFTRTNKDRP
jgi:hypothetical protein